MQKHAVVMHPLPMLDEVSMWCFERLWHFLYGLWKNHLCFYLTFSSYKNLFQSLEFCFLLITLQVWLLRKFSCIFQIGIVWICIWNWYLFVVGCFICQPLIFIAFDCHIPHVEPAATAAWLQGQAQQKFQSINFWQATLFLLVVTFVKNLSVTHTHTKVCFLHIYHCCLCYTVL
jgi:hypothetical protein